MEHICKVEGFVQSSMDLELLFGVLSVSCSRQVICNDRIGRKIRVKCNPDDTIADLKKLIAAQSLCRIRRLADFGSVLIVVLTGIAHSIHFSSFYLHFMCFIFW